MKKPTQCHLWQKEELIPSDFDFENIKKIIESSHFDCGILRCKKCEQLYFYQSYEEVDFEGGNDSQYDTYIPIESENEANVMAKLSPIELLQFSPRLQWDSNNPTIKWIGK